MGTPSTKPRIKRLEAVRPGADSKIATFIGRSIDLAHESAFELAALRVSPASREVRFGPNLRSLEPRIMQVLVVLARDRGQVVSRQDLVDACWGGRIVSGDTLNRCIAAIRRLAEASSSFTITTVARVGYRLDELGSRVIGLARTPIAKSERRQLTALTCRLHRPGGTTRLDPEEWHAIVTEYRRTAVAAVEQWGGYIAERIGDRLVAYFGVPQAREDAAERAIRTGLAIVESMAELNARVFEAHGLRLAVQIGIHAAVVLVARDGAGNLEIFGEASDVAALAQAEAAPDTVLITRAVHELVANATVIDDQRALQLAEVGASVSLYRAVSVSAEPSRNELTPFVGRRDEVHTLISCLKRAREAAGQVVFITGEPGIGKSRLIAELKARVHDAAQIWLECAGAASLQDSPFYAIAQLRRDERPLEQAAVLDWIVSIAKNQPLVLVIEDLHWVDPSTLELIQMLAERAANAPLLLVCTARPEFRASWPPCAHVTGLALERIDDRETRELVTGVRSHRALTEAEIASVIERSDGVPRFAEELTRLVLERTELSGAREIPATLRDGLAARLDRLEDAKEVAQLSAVLGDEFSYVMLRALCLMPEAALQAALSKLEDAALIRVRGLPPDSHYEFRCTLMRDAAYDSLPKSERRALHARVRGRGFTAKAPRSAKD